MIGILGINPTAGQENPRDGGFLISEAPGRLSRDTGVLAVLNDSASSYLAGTVLGKQTIGSNGIFAQSGSGCTCGSIVLSAGVKQGVYNGVCIKAGATGMFELFDPQGILVGIVTVGSAFAAGGVGFTLTDAGSHVAVGDTMTITIGAVTFARGGGDTGNFTCGTVTVDAGILGGVYTFTMIDATHFSGVDPLGRVLPNGVFGTAYHAGGMDFTITAGGTAAVAGDTFTQTTTEGNGEWYPVSAAAFDGTQNAAGILWETTYVGGATALKKAIVVRNCEVKDTELVWPSTATDDQWLNWVLQLEALGIKKRTGIK